MLVLSYIIILTKNAREDVEVYSRQLTAVGSFNLPKQIEGIIIVHFYAIL